MYLSVKPRKKKKKKKKKNLFYERTDLPSKVGWAIFFSGSKNDPKHNNFENKSDNFCRKVLGKYFDSFSKIFQQKLLDFGQKTADFTRFWKNWTKNRAVASLTVPGGQEFHFPHFFLKFWSLFLIFPQTFLIFFLILALRVGESPTQEGPGYATDQLKKKKKLTNGKFGSVAP